VFALSYLLAGMVIVFFHITLSILANMIAGQSVRATAQTLLVVFGSGVGPMMTNWIAGRLSASADNSLQPIFGFGMILALAAFILIAIRAPHLKKVKAQE